MTFSHRSLCYLELFPCLVPSVFGMDADGLEQIPELFELHELFVRLGLLPEIDGPDGLGELLDKLSVNLRNERRAQDALRRNDQAPLVAAAVHTEEDNVAAVGVAYPNQAKVPPHIFRGDVELVCHV